MSFEVKTTAHTNITHHKAQSHKLTTTTTRESTQTETNQNNIQIYSYNQENI